MDIKRAENAIQRISTELRYFDSRKMNPKNEHYQRLLKTINSYHKIINYIKETKTKERYKTMIKAKMTKHNSTTGILWTVTTASRSKSFKTETGAKRWANRNDMYITENNDLTK